MIQSGRTGKCTYCEQEFILSASRRVFCSDKCKTRFSKENTSCFYCGELGESRDHVVPHSLTVNNGRKRQWRSDWVYCCLECNTMLNNYLGNSFYDRVMYLHDIFKRKKKLNKSYVEWDEDDFEDMTSEMRNWILNKQNKRKIDERRLDHIKYTALSIARFEEEQEECKDAV